MGKLAGTGHRRSRFRMVDDRRDVYQGSPARKRSQGWQSGYGSYKRGLNSKIHLAVDAHGMPVRAIVTKGTAADCKLAGRLMEGIAADALLADRAYDTNAVVEQARASGMEVVIPPMKSRKEQRQYDKYLYRLRHLVENAFLKLKRWRGIATRYAKTSASFLAAVQIRCLVLWLDVLA